MEETSDSGILLLASLTEHCEEPLSKTPIPNYSPPPPLVETTPATHDLAHREKYYLELLNGLNPASKHQNPLPHSTPLSLNNNNSNNEYPDSFDLSSQQQRQSKEPKISDSSQSFPGRKSSKKKELEDEERAKFTKDLYEFMDKKGLPINKIPYLGFRELDLFKLYKIVTSKGGMDIVSKKQGWKSVYLDLNIETMSTSASYNTRTNYKKYLYLYELEHFEPEDKLKNSNTPVKFKINDYVKIESPIQEQMYYAQILKKRIQGEDIYYYVHYNGWSNSHDEWMPEYALQPIPEGKSPETLINPLPTRSSKSNYLIYDCNAHLKKKYSNKNINSIKKIIKTIRKKKKKEKNEEWTTAEEDNHSSPQRSNSSGYSFPPSKNDIREEEQETHDRIFLPTSSSNTNSSYHHPNQRGGIGKPSSSSSLYNFPPFKNLNKRLSKSNTLTFDNKFKMNNLMATKSHPTKFSNSNNRSKTWNSDPSDFESYQQRQQQQQGYLFPGIEQRHFDSEQQQQQQRGLEQLPYRPHSQSPSSFQLPQEQGSFRGQGKFSERGFKQPYSELSTNTPPITSRVSPHSALRYSTNSPDAISRSPYSTRVNNTALSSYEPLHFSRPLYQRHDKFNASQSPHLDHSCRFSPLPLPSPLPSLYPPHHSHYQSHHQHQIFHSSPISNDMPYHVVNEINNSRFLSHSQPHFSYPLQRNNTFSNRALPESSSGPKRPETSFDFKNHEPSHVFENNHHTGEEDFDFNFKLNPAVQRAKEIQSHHQHQSQQQQHSFWNPDYHSTHEESLPSSSLKLHAPQPKLHKAFVEASSLEPPFRAPSRESPVFSKRGSPQASLGKLNSLVSSSLRSYSSLSNFSQRSHDTTTSSLTGGHVPNEDFSTNSERPSPYKGFASNDDSLSRPDSELSTRTPSVVNPTDNRPTIDQSPSSGTIIEEKSEPESYVLPPKKFSRAASSVPFSYKPTKKIKLSASEKKLQKKLQKKLKGASSTLSSSSNNCGKSTGSGDSDTLKGRTKTNYKNSTLHSMSTRDNMAPSKDDAVNLLKEREKKERDKFNKIPLKSDCPLISRLSMHSLELYKVSKINLISENVSLPKAKNSSKSSGSGNNTPTSSKKSGAASSKAASSSQKVSTETYEEQFKYFEKFPSIELLHSTTEDSTYKPLINLNESSSLEDNYDISQIKNSIKKSQTRMDEIKSEYVQYMMHLNELKKTSRSSFDPMYSGSNGGGLGKRGSEKQTLKGL